MPRVIIIGGGAAGMFAALAAKSHAPTCDVRLLEKSNVLLAKVRISGGGRCNVTHHCFDPKSLAQNYPRGHKELLGPFHRFSPKDTVDWFKERNIPLKCEEDGRMFPTTDSSQTIIDCLVDEAARLNIPIEKRMQISSIEKQDESFILHFVNGEKYVCDKVILATGSSPQGHKWAKALGHTIERPIPSLFTFNSPDSLLRELSGVAVSDVQVRIDGGQHITRGPILLTHFGFSGPAVIKLSAWEAPYLYDCCYRTQLIIRWLPEMSNKAIYDKLMKAKKSHPKAHLGNLMLFSLPKSLWKVLCKDCCDIALSHVSNKTLDQIAHRLIDDRYAIEGKTTFKKEFVTCGGVQRAEVNFKTMESKVCPGLFFAGEVLDIDGVTGGFNFQNAWTTGWIAGHAATSDFS